MRAINWLTPATATSALGYTSDRAGMKLIGRDVFAAVREAVGVKPECPISAVQINTPLNGAATLTVELILTPEMLKQISDAVNKGVV